MRFTYASLNERQRRLYAATEALKLGHGGIAYIAQLFDCHRKTIQRGLADLQSRRCAAAAQPGAKKGVADVAVCRSFPGSTKPS